jgi:ribose 5-phosphate isomerase B
MLILNFMTRQIFIASDHAGVRLKTVVVHFLRAKNEDVQDLGPQTEDSIDYPDRANAVCAALHKNPDSLGILLCGSGIGMSIAANRHRHIRAALVYSEEFARLARLHNNANVLVLGARVISEAVALRLLEVFLGTEFEGGRHARRVEKLG